MPTPTPVVENVKELTFGEAMDAVAQGAKVKRKEWGDNAYVYLNTWLLVNIDGVDHTLKVTDGDMLGTDWFILD